MQGIKLTVLSQFTELDIREIIATNDQGDTSSFARTGDVTWELNSVTFDITRLTLISYADQELAYADVNVYNGSIHSIILSLKLNYTYGLTENSEVDITYSYSAHEIEPNTPQAVIPKEHLYQGLLANNRTIALNYVDPVTGLRYQDEGSAQFEVITNLTIPLGPNQIRPRIAYSEFKDLSGLSDYSKVRRTYPEISNSDFIYAIGSLYHVDYTDDAIKLKFGFDEVHGFYKYFISNKSNVGAVYIADRYGYYEYTIGDLIATDLYPNEILRIFDNLIVQSGNDLWILKALETTVTSGVTRYRCTIVKYEDYTIARCSDFGHCIHDVANFQCRSPIEDFKLIDLDSMLLDTNPWVFGSLTDSSTQANEPINYYFDFLNANQQVIKSQMIKVHNAIKFIKSHEHVDDFHLFDEMATYIVGDLLYWISYSDYDQIIDYMNEESGYGLAKKYGKIPLDRTIDEHSFTKSDLVRIDCDGLKVQLLYSKDPYFYEVIIDLVAGTITNTSHSSLDDLWNNSSDSYRGITKTRSA